MREIKIYIYLYKKERDKQEDEWATENIREGATWKKSVHLHDLVPFKDEITCESLVII